VKKVVTYKEIPDSPVGELVKGFLDVVTEKDDKSTGKFIDLVKVRF